MEEDGYGKISKRIDAAIEKFNKDVLESNPELLTKPDSEFFKLYRVDIDNELTEAVYEMFMRSWLLGMVHNSRKGNHDFSDISVDFGLTFEDAVRMAEGRIALTPDQFYRLSDHMKMQAFTVGRLSQMDMIEKVKKVYEANIKESISIDAFLKDVHEVVGDEAGFAGYYSTVYRTNLQKDYNAGKAMQMKEDPPPFLEFVAIEDERISDICKPRAGVVLPYSDPWWDSNWPPLHFNCRSTVREIPEEEAIERGLLKIETKEERKKRIEEYNKLSNTEKTRINEANNERKRQELEKFSRMKAYPAAKGFGHNPAKDNAFWNVTASQQERIARTMIQEELNGFAGLTICKDFKSEKPGYITMKTEKGGVRYDRNLLKSSEFKGNSEIAEILANQEGYYVELRKAPLLRGNPQFDAWVNADEKYEFKDLTSDGISALRKEIRKAGTQARNIVIRIKYKGQIRTLITALTEESISMVNRYDVKQVKIISNDQIVTLTQEDLVRNENISMKLAWLYES